jgi:phytanoyl-CoA hydroxylase|tara:strand:- start:777 stop:1685 length:909 start_codon:yes stop_codon:yes gene_type:complete
MITNEQINYYKDKGYLVVENAIPQDKLKELQKVTDEYVANSKDVVVNDEVYDLADDHSSTNPNLRRLKNPHLLHDVYKNITEDACILDIVEKLVGKNIRRDHTKLNFKSARGGESIEWHQDWAFYPHTNDDIVEVGIFLDDCGEENGPLMAVPGSHKGPLDDHHHQGVFIGAVDPANSHYDLSTAEPFLAKAGSISLHHVRSLHGSKKNNSEKSRRVLFVGYTAADSWPLKGILDLGLKPTSSEGDFVKNIYSVYEGNIVRGDPCLEARVENNPIKMPYPPPHSVGSIYENQKVVRGRSFGE